MSVKPFYGIKIIGTLFDFQIVLFSLGLTGESLVVYNLHIALLKTRTEEGLVDEL